MRKGQLISKVAIVTGASSGIGRDTALAFAREGATVIATSRNRAALDALEKAAAGFPGSIHAAVTDVTDGGQTDRLVEETVKIHGRLDILVCNAGIYTRKLIRDSAVTDYEQAMTVNFFGSIRIILKALPGMLERRSGHIVAVTSVDGKKGLTKDGVYCSSKFALMGFMDVLRQELRGTGVSATTILPGRVDTPMIENLKVPLMSAKISSATVAHAIVRAIRKRKAEVIIPYPGPKLLILASAVWAPLGDWLVRLFRLEGVEVRR